MQDTPQLKPHPPGHDALTMPGQPEQGSFSRQAGLHAHEQPAGPPSMVWVPGAGCMPLAPPEFYQQLQGAVTQSMVEACAQQVLALRQELAQFTAGRRQSAPHPSVQPQLQLQPPMQLPQPELPAQATSHSLPPAPIGRASPAPQQPAAAPGPGLPKLSVYDNLSQLCEAWFVGQYGLPPLKDLQQGQRGGKQRWSELSTFMQRPAELLRAGRSLAKAVQELEAERVSLEAQRFEHEAETFRQRPKGRAPKRPALTVAGFVSHKTNKRAWV